MTVQNPLVDGVKVLWNNVVHHRKFNRGAMWGALILIALGAFEIFNFGTTQFALHDVLGDLSFAGMQWSTMLAIAFCGIDFAGIARIFTPEQGRDEPTEVWYLFGAWVLAAGFNATLTWWGVAVAIAENGLASRSAVVVSPETLTTVVPVFVAFMVWLIRLLIIGTFSLAGDRLFTTVELRSQQYRPQYQQQPQRTTYTAPQSQRTYNNPQPEQRPTYQTPRPVNQPTSAPVLRPASQLPRPANAATNNNFRPAPKPAPTTTSQQGSFLEPTYHPITQTARGFDNSDRHYS